jgi:hypothetical protein
MKRVTSTIAMASMLAALAIPVSAPRAQSKGASATVRVGEVTAREQVELDNQSTQKGALIGGAIGLAAGSGKSGKTRRRRAAGGAAVGAAAGSTKGKDTGMMYTVKTGDGALVKVVTDQLEIQQGDCVAVEESGGKANIRRISPTACEPESQEVMNDPAIQHEMQEEAAECAAAKEELVAAETDEAFDRAIRKVEILCDN